MGDFDKEITQLPLLQVLHYPIQKFGGFCERFWSLFPTKIADRVYMMADLEGDEAIKRLLEPEGDEMARENDASPPQGWQDMQSTMDGQFQALSGNIKEGFASLGQLLTGLLNKRSRQKSSSSSSNCSSDDERERSPKRPRVEDEQTDNEAASKPQASQADGEQSPKPDQDNVDDNDKQFVAILDSVVQELAQEQSGPSVSDQLANVINTTLRSKLSEEKLKEKQNAYPRPKNCETLETPRVNPEIWSQLESSTRSCDIRLQKVQGLLLKGLLPLIQLLENCRQSKDAAYSMDKGKLVKLVLDAITLFSQANVELNSRRRAMIKPDLNEKFQQICSEHVPITGFLFGDDVAKTLQDIASTNRVSQKVAQTPRYTPGHHTYPAHKKPKNGRGRHRPRNNLPRRKGAHYKAQNQ